MNKPEHLNKKIPLPELPQRGFSFFSCQALLYNCRIHPAFFPCLFCRFFAAVSGVVQFCRFNSLLKVFVYRVRIKKQLFGIFSRKSTKSCVHYNPEIDKTGKKWGKPHFMGKKSGSLLFACQPISEPGIKPSALLIWRRQNTVQNNRIST